MTAKEAYFGLRIRAADDASQAVNIPVNTTVGPSGAPQHQEMTAAYLWPQPEVTAQKMSVTSAPRFAGARTNCAPVSSAGTVLVTFKSRLSLPPYRIENACSDVAIWFAQVR